MRVLALALLLPVATPVYSQDVCNEVKLALLAETQDVHCVQSTDLTTANQNTTPQDNSRLGLPPSAFTPRTDAQAVSPDAPFRTPITRMVPGLQITGATADDADARWVCACRRAGTASWWSACPAACAASSWAITSSATSSCSKAMPTRQPTRARSISSSPSR